MLTSGPEPHEYYLLCAADVYENATVLGCSGALETAAHGAFTELWSIERVLDIRGKVLFHWGAKFVEILA